MNTKRMEITVAILLGLVMPSILFSRIKIQSQGDMTVTLPTQYTQAQSAEKETIQVVMENGEVTSLDLDTYILYVLLAEMPAEFEIEALKAQAVVSRTYALRRCITTDKHERADVCTSPQCCQGFCTEDRYLERGGTVEMVDKVRTAVQSTTGQVLYYKGELIDATFFSCSGGMTEDAQAVWGSDVPYLQATSSPGEEIATHYIDTVVFSAERFADLLGCELSGNPALWVEDITYTRGGGVETIRIKGMDFRGTDLRNRLGLRSTAFVITALGDTITITTKGFGHRVGMSQYGAEAMAMQGSTYQQILTHYYCGVDLLQYMG